MVPNMLNSKQTQPVDHFSLKDHFNPLYIDRYMVNGVDGINKEVLAGYVDDTIV